jgi:hypothetical protein
LDGLAEHGSRVADKSWFADGSRVAGVIELADGSRAAEKVELANGSRAAGKVELANGSRAAGKVKLADGSRVAGKVGVAKRKPRPAGNIFFWIMCVTWEYTSLGLFRTKILEEQCNPLESGLIGVGIAKCLEYFCDWFPYHSVQNRLQM